MAEMPRGLFIVGNDTGVGKTYVAALVARDLVARGVRVGVYKPAASDCQLVDGELVADDAAVLWDAAGRPATLERVCPQRFAAPLAPHLAARAEAREVDADLLRSGAARWAGECDVLIVEGAGGLMSPMTDDDYVATLAEDIGYPLVVVARNALGVINQTLQTLIAAAAWGEGLDVAGIVLNASDPAVDDVSRQSNRQELKRRAIADVLAEVAWGADRFDCEVDWEALAAEPRE